MSQLERNKQNGISYLTAGTGEPILFLHGIPGSAYIWEAVAESLAARGYRVIVPDLMGFGESDAPPGDYYMADQAHALAELLDALGISEFVLATHDFGGPVGITLMRLHPEKHVKALIITNTNLSTTTPVPLPLKIASVPVLGAAFYDAAMGTRFGNRLLFMAAFKQKKDDSWEKFKRSLNRSGLHYTSKIFHRSIRDLKRNYAAVEAHLPQITAPTLILWAGSDPLFSVKSGEDIARAIPNAQIKIYDKTGHFVPDERPEQVTDDIDHFLQAL